MSVKCLHFYWLDLAILCSWDLILVSHKCHFFIKNKRKKHLKRCKIVPKGKRKWTIHNESSICGRGIRIRTLNDGVRVRSVTVTLYLYIKLNVKNES